MLGFAQYLEEKGLITADVILKVMDMQMDSRVPLGRMAIDHRMMTVKQVLEVLRKQATGDKRNFGEIAIGLAYITKDQIDFLVNLQGKSSKSFADLLIELDILSLTQVQVCLEEYERIKK